MATYFRIVQERWAATAMDGEGARRYGGRWNPPGLPAVYLAESRALAALEIIVHAPREVLALEWRVIEVDIPDDLVGKLTRKPSEWRELPWSAGARNAGARFLRQAKLLALEVPSVVIPEERNLLLNPNHPEAGRLKISKPKVFRMDARV